MRESEFVEYLPASFDSELSHQIYSAFQKDPLIASSLNAETLVPGKASRLINCASGSLDFMP